MSHSIFTAAFKSAVHGSASDAVSTSASAIALARRTARALVVASFAGSRAPSNTNMGVVPQRSNHSAR
eukprot:CAMPEP_0197575254 /NCGR_PEP_ID=MMETSP1326-20131121/708_1 /TAXON_ID=1155430 /ORGANISM="Genus nov. species nov., Strain RCC2288" /LENGTH=67 /DNA_ID=CAMNT_0043137987 /DNA_START=536 /DNA_END=739 /DNA_ORIENTATION=-